MSRVIDCAGGCAWRAEVVHSPSAESDRCIMLHGPDGEVVGPLTMALAEAWIDHFDAARLDAMQRQQQLELAAH